MAAGPYGSDAAHRPVLLTEVIESLSLKNKGLYVDGTFGAGGYSRAILQAQEDVELIAIDQDPDVYPYVKPMQDAYPERFTFLQGRFGDAKALLEGIGVTQVDGFVLDIGVSSMQLDRPERGFSFSSDGPLDMRMAQSGLTAYEVVNESSEAELADIIFHYGEEKAARKIARGICYARRSKSIDTTWELAEIVRKSVRVHRGKGRSSGIDDATRTFQALRIYVNDELGELEKALKAAASLLAPGGRLVVVVFHSLEDRIVKQFFAKLCGRDAGTSRHIPEAVQKTPEFSPVTKKAVTPGEDEIHFNPRSRSSKLRAVMRREEAV